MVHEPVTALICPACGGPLADPATRRCAFCGVALILPDDSLAVPAGDTEEWHRELVRLRARLRADPSRADTHCRLGRVYERLGLTDDAVRALTVAVGLAPENTGTRLRLATLLASRSAAGVPDAFPAAMRHVRQVLVLAPDSIDARLLLARLQTQRGDFDAARAALARVAGLSTDESRRREAWITLAEAAAWEHRGDRTGAVANWRLASAMAPDLARAAVVGFLDRTVPAHHVVAPARIPARGGWRSGPGTPLPRSSLVAVAVAVAVAAVGAGLTPVVALPVALMALVPPRRPPHREHRRAARTLARRQDPATGLDDLLRVAGVIAARLDTGERTRQRQWVDSLPLGITTVERPRVA